MISALITKASWSLLWFSWYSAW